MLRLLLLLLLLLMLLQSAEMVEETSHIGEIRVHLGMMQHRWRQRRTGGGGGVAAVREFRCEGGPGEEKGRRQRLLLRRR